MYSKGDYLSFPFQEEIGIIYSSLISEEIKEIKQLIPKENRSGQMPYHSSSCNREANWTTSEVFCNHTSAGGVEDRASWVLRSVSSENHWIQERMLPESKGKGLKYLPVCTLQRLGVTATMGLVCLRFPSQGLCQLTRGDCAGFFGTKLESDSQR